MSQHKRLVVQVRQDQWDWLQSQTEAFQPVSTVVRNIIDAAMKAAETGSVSE